jgi:hypothetical protein
MRVAQEMRPGRRPHSVREPPIGGCRDRGRRGMLALSRRSTDAGTWPTHAGLSHPSGEPPPVPLRDGRNRGDLASFRQLTVTPAPLRRSRIRGKPDRRRVLDTQGACFYPCGHGRPVWSCGASAHGLRPFGWEGGASSGAATFPSSNHSAAWPLTRTAACRIMDDFPQPALPSRGHGRPCGADCSLQSGAGSPSSVGIGRAVRPVRG